MSIPSASESCSKGLQNYPNGQGFFFSFLKFKQDGSGYPSHVSTKEAKQTYIEEYYEKECIKLNPGNIAVNKAVRNGPRYI